MTTDTTTTQAFVPLKDIHNGVITRDDGCFVCCVYWFRLLILI